jgi:hypothetical protein
MTIDEIYIGIKLGDQTGLQEYLDELPANPTTLKFMDSLCIHAVKWNQLDILKMFVEYAANLSVPWSSSYLLEYAIQLNRRDMIEYLRPKVDTDRNEIPFI